MARRKPDHDHREDRFQINSPKQLIGIFPELSGYAEQNVILAGFFDDANQLAKPMNEVAPC
jgi:hypothetical protein